MLLNRFNALAAKRPSHFTPLEEGTVLDLYTKEVWQDLGFAGKGEYLASVSDEVGMIPDDVSPEARELRVSKMASRFEAGLPIFEGDEFSRAYTAGIAIFQHEKTWKDLDRVLNMVEDEVDQDFWEAINDQMTA